MNTTKHEQWSTTQPLIKANIIPPNPDRIVAKPQIESTTLFGYTLAGNASMFTEHAECRIGLVLLT